MADSNYRRSRRPDSKQMWDETEGSHSARDNRDREPRRDHRDDRDRDRRRNYRSRSRDRRDERGERRGGRGHNGRDRGGYQSRDGERGQYRGDSALVIRSRGPWTDGCEDDGRSKPRDRERERRRSRSRSPRLEKDLPLRSTENGSGSRSGSALPTGSRAGRGERARDERMDSEPTSTGIAIKSKDVIEEPERYEDEDVIVEEEDGLAAMQAMMGFGGFGTTKQKKVPGNDVSAVRKEKKTEYRQYMNRVGGFNRPLSPPRE